MKYIIYLFLVILLIPLALPHHTDAASPCQSKIKGYCMSVSQSPPPAPKPKSLLQYATAFPGIEFLEPYGVTLEETDPGNMLSAVYNFGIAIAGISALIMYMAAGILWATAVSPGNIGKAREYIANATFGLILIATSYLILYTINPDFSFKLTIPSLRELREKEK